MGRHGGGLRRGARDHDAGRGFDFFVLRFEQPLGECEQAEFACALLVLCRRLKLRMEG